MEATVVVVVERGGRSCRGEMLAVGVPVGFCLLILYDAIRKAVRASEVVEGKSRLEFQVRRIKKISLIIFDLKVKRSKLLYKGRVGVIK